MMLLTDVNTKVFCSACSAMFRSTGTQQVVDSKGFFSCLAPESLARTMPSRDSAESAGRYPSMAADSASTEKNASRENNSVVSLEAVSYTHLTLPTNREV